MTPTATEETALATRTEVSSELAPTAAAAEKQFEIQSAIAIAKRFPRNEDQAFERLMRAASRTSFAEDAAYSFPRGGQPVEGPSVNLAREAARVWGNIRYGLDIIRDDDDSRQIRGWAWDMESNTKNSAEDDFRKLIQRKNRNGPGTAWVAPDERDLRELTNRRGAILVRNCILQLLPKDLIEDALEQCTATIKKGAEADPDGARKKLILAFSSLSVTPEMLEKKLGHPIATCSPSEIADLRTMYKSIADGNSTWAEYVAASAGDPIQPRRASETSTSTPALTTPDAPAPSSASAPTEAAPGNAAPSAPATDVEQARGLLIEHTGFVRPKTGEPYYEISAKTTTGRVLKLITRDEALYKEARSFEQTDHSVVVGFRKDGTTVVLVSIAIYEA